MSQIIGKQGVAIPKATAKQVGSGVLKVASATTRQVHRGAVAINSFVANNHWTLKVMSILGFIMVLVFSIMALLGYRFSKALDSRYVMHIYMILFSLANLLSEAGDTWPLFGSIRKFMFSQLGFLKHNLGRGFYNLFFGIIFSSIWSMPEMLVGIYVIIVAFLYFGAHCRGTGETQVTEHVELAEDPVTTGRQ